jgi:hypothetical protein
VSNLSFVDNSRLRGQVFDVYGGDGGQGLQSAAGCPIPASTGGLTTVPEAAVTHVHPLIVPAVKKPWPSLVRRELLTNQVADDEMS